jgi:hypothetical protein
MDARLVWLYDCIDRVTLLAGFRAMYTRPSLTMLFRRRPRQPSQSNRRRIAHDGFERGLLTLGHRWNEMSALLPRADDEPGVLFGKTPLG